MLWAVSAFGQQVTFEAVTQVEYGRGDPSVTFRSAVDGKLTVKLACDGTSFARTTGVKAGGVWTLPLTGLAKGRHACTGTARLDEPTGDWAESPLSFTVSLLATLQLSATAGDVDLAKHTLVVHADRPLKAAEVRVIGEDGAVLATETATLLDPLAPSFRWVADGEVLKLAVTATDEAGVRSELELSPWTYAIPHVDVVFATGSAEITAAEAAKLEQCWADVERVLGKYGRVVDIELFVGGYTDTVGSSTSNQGLSERRAAAIAGWFVQRGFSRPVWYQGFGEDALLQPTPDETDALANRRAMYLLAAEAPPVGPNVPRTDWKRR